MKRVYCLSGEWELTFFEEMPNIRSPEEIHQLGGCRICATVPGNFEIDLARAGVIDSDLYRGMKTQQNEKWEGYDWWYRKEFDQPEVLPGKRYFLSFQGVDCIADYYLNGCEVSSSYNALIEHHFEITEAIRPGRNTLYVHIRSAMRYAHAQAYNQYLALTSKMGHQAYLRKSAHCFGWDIFPRAVSGGIWRDVFVECWDGVGISELSYYVRSADEGQARIVFAGVLDLPYELLGHEIQLRLNAVCGTDSFAVTHALRRSRLFSFSVCVATPRLWWPYGYGEPNVYDLTCELVIDGCVRDTYAMNLGIRTVRLERTDSLLEDGHCFRFVVNGVPVMCRGSNWVPLDAYHSRIREKYQKALALFTDTHCNMLRVWGGGIYEEEEFYDYCDRHGIMVWQDFCMACYTVSYDEATCRNIEAEATHVVKKLRHHPSLVLWAGDNEIDEMLADQKKASGKNPVNRKLLPMIVELHDTMRPYLASSPYLESKTHEKYGNGADVYPERHLWGARDYYKADFYARSKAHFASEMGYHGCPGPDSIRKIVDDGFQWPVYNEQWALHSSDQLGSLARVRLMDDQIAQLFGIRAENLEDFSLASQISQAEAKKFFVERFRVGKPYTSGIIWWNMLDGWPQMSDAVVDYFFEKKLAYGYIRRSQQPMCLMMDEMKDWAYRLVASNDTLQRKTGTYRVFEVMSGKEYARGSFSVGPNENMPLADIPMLYSDRVFLVIRWECDGNVFFNHYLCGYPPFDLAQYRQWLDAYEGICEA